MAEGQRIPIQTDGDIVLARQAGRTLAEQLFFGKADQALIATAISELARNIVNYAGSGAILISVVRKTGSHGIRVIASDRGPGIANVELAMRDGYSTGRSLGLGLPGTKRIVDEFRLDTALGQGVTVTVTKWKR